MSSMKARIIELLRWSERYTKTDMVYLTRGGFWLLTSNLLQAASGLILLVAFANLLSKDSLGIYQFFLSMAAILSAFTLTGMDTAVTRAVTQGNEGALRYGFRAKLAWSAAIALLSGVIALYYFIQGNYSFAIAFLIIGGCAPFIESFSLYGSYLTGKKMFKEHAFFGVCRKPLPIVGVVVSLFFTNEPTILLAVYFGTQVLSLGLIYIKVLNQFSLPDKEDNEMVSYAKHLSVMNVISRIAQDIDQVIVFQLLGPTALATYVIAYNPVKRLQGLMGIVKRLMLPKFTMTRFSMLQNTLPRKLWVARIVIFFAVLAYILIAPYMFALLFPAYADAVLVTQALALTVLAIPRSMLTQAFTAHRKTRELYIIQAIVPIVRIVLFVTLIPLFGLWGAVYSLWITYIFSSLLIGFLFKNARP